jgi:hypothetical protein
MEKLCTQEEEDRRSVAFKLRREEHVGIAACASPTAVHLELNSFFFPLLDVHFSPTPARRQC